MDAMLPTTGLPKAVPAQPRQRRHALANGKPLAAAPASDTVPAVADLATCIDVAARRGDLAPAITALQQALMARSPPDDPLAPLVVRLLTLVAGQLAGLPALADIAWTQVPFDDRVAHAFEQLTALIRQQDAQMAALQTMIAELL